MSMARSPRQYLGVRAILPPDLQTATRNPTTTDTAYVKGTLWLNTSAQTAWMWPGSGSWISLGSNTSSGTSSAMTAGVVTVATTASSSTAVILYSRKTAGGTVGNVSITAQSGTGFTLTSSSNTETSTFNWFIIQ